MTEFHTKTVILRSGERLPVLLDCTGIPLYGPTLFGIAEVRNRHRASNTIRNSLSALSLFHILLTERGIDLDARLQQGKLLEIGEIEALVSMSRRHLRSEGPPCVTADVCATRLRTVAKYLAWLAKCRILRADYPHTQSLQSLLKATIETISARLPPTRQNDDPRQGLDPTLYDKAAELFAALAPTWHDPHVKIRNQLIWEMLFHLGIRGGELLGIRIGHINLREGSLHIVRQADNPDDPRRVQPNTKTRARVVPLSHVLQGRISDYILHSRRKVPGALKHDFLLVSRYGTPLSRSGLCKIFTVARERCPDLPSDVTAHVLRHTWNDRFSAELDGKKVDPNVETRARSYQMGWSETSKAAAAYTRRFVRAKAQQVSLELQRKSMVKESDE